MPTLRATSAAVSAVVAGDDDDPDAGVVAAARRRRRPRVAAGRAWRPARGASGRARHPRARSADRLVEQRPASNGDHAQALRRVAVARRRRSRGRPARREALARRAARDAVATREHRFRSALHVTTVRAIRRVVHSGHQPAARGSKLNLCRLLRSPPREARRPRRARGGAEEGDLRRVARARSPVLSSSALLHAASACGPVPGRRSAIRRSRPIAPVAASRSPVTSHPVLGQRPGLVRADDGRSSRASRPRSDA